MAIDASRGNNQSGTYVKDAAGVERTLSNSDTTPLLNICYQDLAFKQIQQDILYNLTSRKNVVYLNKFLIICNTIYHVIKLANQVISRDQFPPMRDQLIL